MCEIPIMIILFSNICSYWVSLFHFGYGCYFLTPDQSILSYGSRQSKYCIPALYVSFLHTCIYKKKKILNFIANKFKAVEQNLYFANEPQPRDLVTISKLD